MLVLAGWLGSLGRILVAPAYIHACGRRFPEWPCDMPLWPVGCDEAGRGGAARVAPVDKLSVVLVAVRGTVFLGERLSPLSWLGVALGAGGILLVAYRA